MSYEGIKFVLDLEACLYYSEAGGNLKKNLFQKAKDTRVAITKEIFDQVKIFDKDLADEIAKSDIEIVDLETAAYEAAAAMTELLVVSGVALNSAMNEKMPLIGVVHCAKNGSKPPCQIVTGDDGSHTSSMSELCKKLKIAVIPVNSF